MTIVMSVETERAARSTCSISVAPPARCRTLAYFDFIRVLLPAARIRTRRLSIICLEPFNASELAHFEDGLCQPVGIVTDYPVFGEQIAFHDIQSKSAESTLVYVHHRRSFGV